MLSGTKVGEPSKTIDIHELLVSDGGMARTMLLKYEWDAARRIATETMKGDDWPEWLR